MSLFSLLCIFICLLTVAELILDLLPPIISYLYTLPGECRLQGLADVLTNPPTIYPLIDPV